MKKTVKLLSVRQPWAYLLVAGIKPVENRTWWTNHRDELYIHAGIVFDWNFFWFVDNNKHHAEIAGAAYMVIRHFGIRFGDTPEESAITRHQDEFGAVVGRVNLTDCTQEPVGVWAEPELWHWRVINPVAVKPIPMCGQLRIFNAEIEVDKLMIEVNHAD